MYKEDLGLNNLQSLICHKTQWNKPNKSTLCYGIAEGFRFMPLSLVKLRTFGSAHGLVRCNIEAGVNAGARERMEVSLRCHNSPRRYWVTRCGWRHEPEARGGLCENMKRESGTRRQTRRIDFWNSQAGGELAPYGGGARDGGQMNKTT